MLKGKLIKIFKDYDIDYRLHGKNIKKGNIGLCCPFCGDDTGYHLGIDPKTGWFSCWKNKGRHSGKSIVYLLRKLLRLTKDQAIDLLNLGSTADDFDFIKTIDQLFTEQEQDEKTIGIPYLELPEEFRQIESEGSTKFFWNYLKDRGFDDLNFFIEVFNLKCAMIGDFANRIIFPIYFNKNLVSWQGRSRYVNAYLRYKDLAPDKSVRPLKDCLYLYDSLMNNSNQKGRLWVTEGVIDALKLNWYGTGLDWATCLFTYNISDEQLKLLNRLSKKFETVYLVLDKGAELQVFEVLEKLSFIPNIKVAKIPELMPVKDTGAMSREQVKYFIKSFNKV